MRNLKLFVMFCGLTLSGQVMAWGNNSPSVNINNHTRVPITNQNNQSQGQLSNSINIRPTSNYNKVSGTTRLNLNRLLGGKSSSNISIRW